MEIVFFEFFSMPLYNNIVFTSFLHFVWTGENDSTTPRKYGYFFYKGIKKKSPLRFQKYPDTWTGPKSQSETGFEKV